MNFATHNLHGSAAWAFMAGREYAHARDWMAAARRNRDKGKLHLASMRAAVRWARDCNHAALRYLRNARGDV